MDQPVTHGGARPGSGPPKLPDEVKKQRGTFRADKANPNPVRLPCAKVPDPPEDLNEREREWWRAFAAGVNAVGVYTEADAISFRILVRSMALLEAAHAGEVLEEAAAGVFRVVSVTSIVSLTRTVSSLLTRYGLDPSSRDKLVPAPRAETGPEADDPDDFKPIQ